VGSAGHLDLGGGAVGLVAGEEATPMAIIEATERAREALIGRRVPASAVLIARSR
jgi:hypothetical protein